MTRACAIAKWLPVHNPLRNMSRTTRFLKSRVRNHLQNFKSLTVAQNREATTANSRTFG